MNAAQYYKFFLNLSPAILNRHQFLFSGFSKTQGNTLTQAAQSKAPLYKPLGACMAAQPMGNGQSILLAGGSSRVVSKHAQSDVNVLRDSPHSRSGVTCFVT